MHVKPIMIAGVLCLTLAQTTHAFTNQAEIREIIRQEAARQDVPVALVLAVAKVESNFNPRAQSPVGARGVMQIMPVTAKGEFGISAEALWDPRINVQTGIRFLRLLHKQYDNRWDLALSHYNGGTIRPRNGQYHPHSYTAGYLDKIKQAIPAFLPQAPSPTVVQPVQTAVLSQSDLPRKKLKIGRPGPVAPKPLTYQQQTTGVISILRADGESFILGQHVDCRLFHSAIRVGKNCLDAAS